MTSKMIKTYSQSSLPSLSSYYCSVTNELSYSSYKYPSSISIMNSSIKSHIKCPMSESYVQMYSIG